MVLVVKKYLFLDKNGLDLRHDINKMIVEMKKGPLTSLNVLHPRVDNGAWTENYRKLLIKKCTRINNMFKSKSKRLL